MITLNMHAGRTHKYLRMRVVKRQGLTLNLNRVLLRHRVWHIFSILTCMFNKRVFADIFLRAVLHPDGMWIALWTQQTKLDRKRTSKSKVVMF